MGGMTSAIPFIDRLAAAIPLPGRGRKIVRVLELYGAIGGAGPSSRSLTLARLEPSLEAAFRPGPLAAVALAINSPGGSPVQVALIAREILRRAAARKVPVLAFIEDVGASGGYLLALAADEIYAEAASIVGSIGVVSAGFGFQDAIKRLGVERRVFTAGADKAGLDPFRPLRQDDLKRLEAILVDIHADFIAFVRERRAGRIDESAGDLFSGAFWTAGPARERGLIDGIARLNELCRTRFGDNVRIKRVARQGSPLRLLLGGAHIGNQTNVGNQANAGNEHGPHGGAGSVIDPLQALDALEERAIWARFGL